jgi:protein phosphatase
MVSEIRRGAGGLQREGFRQVWKLSSADSTEAAAVICQPLWTDKRKETGPFDIIGDVHGCAGELQALLARLGYRVEWSDGQSNRDVTVTPPAGRTLVLWATSSIVAPIRRMCCVSR